MQLKSLKIFCDVVNRRSFSRAAAENGITQSGASHVVLQLEERLGVKLIDRSKRPFVLTHEGRIYYDGCRELVQRYFALEDDVHALHDEIAGRVVVASIYSAGLYQMDRCVKEFLAAHGKANVRLEYLHPAEVSTSIENDEADLGVVSYPRSSRTLEAVPWRKEPMVLVCAPECDLAASESIDLVALNGRKMVGFDGGLMIRRQIDRALQSEGVEVEMAMEFDNIETIKRAIEINAGFGLLPEPTVEREVDTGSLVKVGLSTGELTRPLGILHRRGKTLSSTAHRFLEVLLTAGPEEELVQAGNGRSGGVKAR